MTVRVYSMDKDNLSDCEATCKFKRGSPPLDWKDIPLLRKRLHLRAEGTYVVYFNRQVMYVPAEKP